MESELIGRLVIYLVVLLMAVSAHEAAHAWMSYKFGDDTAYLLGRVTLNPIAHTDPIGTLLIPIMGFIFASVGGALGSIPLIGWGKPTPVNPLRWRNKDTANIMVSLAGIMANTAIAVITLIIIKVLQRTDLFNPGGALESIASPVGILLQFSLYMNASLAVFNLLPFPPLDGSKILYSILPPSMHSSLDALEQYGFLILMAAIYFGVFDFIFYPVNRLLNFLLSL